MQVKDVENLEELKSFLRQYKRIIREIDEHIEQVDKEEKDAEEIKENLELKQDKRFDGMKEEAEQDLLAKKNKKQRLKDNKREEQKQIVAIVNKYKIKLKTEKSRALFMYNQKQDEWIKGIEKGKKIKLAIPGSLVDVDNLKFNKKGKQVGIKSRKTIQTTYNSLIETHRKHMKELTRIAKEKNELYQEYKRCNKELTEIDDIVSGYGVNIDEILKKDNSEQVISGQRRPEQARTERIDPEQQVRAERVDPGQQARAERIDPGQQARAERIDPEQPKLDMPEYYVKTIAIDEKNGEVYVGSEGREGEKNVTKFSLDEVLKSKRTLFKNLEIDQLCKMVIHKSKRTRKNPLMKQVEIAKLKRKINPAIVKVFEKQPDMLVDYIACLYKNDNERYPLPYDLTHIVSDSSLRFLDKIKMKRWVKTEKELGANIITYDQNETFPVNQEKQNTSGWKQQQRISENMVLPLSYLKDIYENFSYDKNNENGEYDLVNKKTGIKISKDEKEYASLVGGIKFAKLWKDSIDKSIDNINDLSEKERINIAFNNSESETIYQYLSNRVIGQIMTKGNIDIGNIYNEAQSVKTKDVIQTLGSEKEHMNLVDRYFRNMVPEDRMVVATKEPLTIEELNNARKPSQISQERENT